MTENKGRRKGDREERKKAFWEMTREEREVIKKRRKETVRGEGATR